jgi:hypothetical protein
VAQELQDTSFGRSKSERKPKKKKTGKGGGGWQVSMTGVLVLCTVTSTLVFHDIVTAQAVDTLYCSPIALLL